MWLKLCDLLYIFLLVVTFSKSPNCWMQVRAQGTRCTYFDLHMIIRKSYQILSFDKGLINAQQSSTYSKGHNPKPRRTNSNAYFKHHSLIVAFQDCFTMTILHLQHSINSSLIKAPSLAFSYLPKIYCKTYTYIPTQYT